MVRACRLDHLSIGLSVGTESVLWKTADWIRIPFGMVSEVGLGMGVLDFGDGGRRRKGGSLGVNLGRPTVTNGAFATRSSQITLRTCLQVYNTNANRNTLLVSRRYPGLLL